MALDQDLIESMEMAGMPADDIEAAKAMAESNDEFEIWPENWRAVGYFTRLGTQWRAGMGGATGLDYAGVEAALRIWRAPRREWRGLFAAFQIMEAAALDYFNDKRESR